MSASTRPPPDSSVRAGMEEMIAALRGRQPLCAVADSQETRSWPDEEYDESDDEPLAVAAWGAMNLTLPDASEGACCDRAHEATYLERGAIVGRYVVLRKLGAGGMGVVYAAYDPELDRKVALKLVLRGRGDGAGRTRLLREAQALAKLSHRSVVAIHDVGAMGDQVWLAMEFVRGQTLGEWLKQPRDWREVLSVIIEAGRGLAAAHAVGLLHRDFKPENVMVGRGSRVRVMDFGLARARPNVVPMAADESTHEMPVLDALTLRVTHAGTLLGTPVYMAPEQLLDRELGPAVDQYALCVTLWEALYGERPFSGRSLEELVDSVVAGRMRRPAGRQGVPAWLRAVCERGLSVDPQQRFASMDALLDALANGPARARARQGFAAVGLAMLLGLGGEGYRRWDEAPRITAGETSEREVEVTAALHDEHRRALSDALMTTGVSHALGSTHHGGVGRGAATRRPRGSLGCERWLDARERLP